MLKGEIVINKLKPFVVGFFVCLLLGFVLLFFLSVGFFKVKTRTDYLK